MKAKWTGMLTAVVLAATAGIAGAQMRNPGAGSGAGPGPGPMMHQGMGPSGMQGKPHRSMGKHWGGLVHALVMHADELKLTDEQIGKLHRIMMNSQDARREAKKKVMDAKRDLHMAFMDPTKDEAAIRAAAKARDAAEGAVLDLKIKERKDAMAVLTDAQRKQLKDLKPPAPPQSKGPPDDDEED